MSKKSGKTIYSPFAGSDDAGDRYKLKPTSKANVADVCRVMAERMSLGHGSRAQYADQAGIEPMGYETKEDENGEPRKSPIFELDDKWSEFYVHAALGHALFWGFPKLVQAEYDEQSDSFTIEVLDQEKFNALDEGVVNQAFLAFSQQRSGIPNSLLNGSSNASGALNIAPAI